MEGGGNPQNVSGGGKQKSATDLHCQNPALIELMSAQWRRKFANHCATIMGRCERVLLFVGGASFKWGFPPPCKLFQRVPSPPASYKVTWDFLSFFARKWVVANFEGDGSGIQSSKDHGLNPPPSEHCKPSACSWQDFQKEHGARLFWGFGLADPRAQLLTWGKDPELAEKGLCQKRLRRPYS